MARKQSPQLKTNIYYITPELDYIEGTQSRTQSYIILNFILLDQDITKKDRTKKTVKIKVVTVIRYRDTSPNLCPSQGECPYPCTQVSLFGGGGDVVVSFFLNLRLRVEFSSLKSSISCSSLNIFLHNSFLFSYKRWKGIYWILGFFTLLGRLDFLNSMCMSPGWGNVTSFSSELVSSFPFKS